MKNISLIAILIITITACSTSNEKNHKQLDTTFAQLETFSLQSKSPENEPLNNAIINTLKKKGYTFRADGSSDVEVQFEHILKPDVPSNVSVGFGLGGLLGNLGLSAGTSHRTHSDEETINISLVNMKVKNTIWEGSSTNTVVPDTTLAQRQNELNKLLITAFETLATKQ